MFDSYEDPIPSAEDAEEENLVRGDIDADGHGTVVRLDDADDDEDVAMEDEPTAPIADMDEPVAAVPKKRGRPSASASASRTGTPARGRPAKANATASATEPKAAAAKKRAGRPPAITRPVSARKAAVAAKKEVKSLTGRKAAVRALQKLSLLKPKTRLTHQQGVTKPAKAPGRRGRPAKTVEDDGETWEVEAVVDDGIDGDTKEHMYLIKWSGYNDSDNTWEPKQNLKGSEAAIKEYEKVKKLEKKAKKQEGKAEKAAKPEKPVTKSTRGRKPKAKA